MASTHITLDLFRAIHRGERPATVLVRRLLVHLARLCPHCREEVRAVARLRRSLREGEGEAYVLAMVRAFESLQPEGEEGLWGERARARQAAADLLALLPSRRRQAVRAGGGAGGRFRGAPLAALLIDECRGQLPGDAAAAGELAALAQEVLHQSPTGLVAVELYATAAAFRGNARRAAGLLDEAEADFAFARFLLDAGRAGDPLTFAELDLLESSLLRARRRFAAAAERLERAADAYARHGTPFDRARALVGLGVLWRERRLPERAVPPTEEALALLDPDEHPRLVLMARHNLAQFCCDLGQYEEARETLDACEDLYRRFPDAWTQLRRRWLEAAVAGGLGEAAAAEAAYREVREGFLAAGNAYDAALVSLDLAAHYLQQGRTAAVRALAEEMVPLFEAQGVHREAAAALLLFVEAARAERLTRAWLARLGRYLEAARNNPELTFWERPDGGATERWGG